MNLPLLWLEVKPFIESMKQDAGLGNRLILRFNRAGLFLFKKNGRFQVLEVGLGGRLDATNVAKPLVCVITSISLDHTQILGANWRK